MSEDLYEECCPHCGFCGDDHKGRPCGDCEAQWIWGSDTDKERPCKTN